MSTTALFLHAVSLATKADRLTRERKVALAMNLEFPLNQPTQKDPMSTATITAPTAIGTPFEGGFYGGKIKIGIAIFAIVWAPKAEGQIKGKLLASGDDVPGAYSCFDSMANTKALAAAGSSVAQAALAATINGYTDWCLPARDVLEMGYRHFKPTSRANYVSFRDGDNASSVPVGYPYTKDTPAQTQAEAFQAGSPEAFDESWYWSSTLSGEGCAFLQRFDDGDQHSDYTLYEGRCRYVRLIQLNDYSFNPLSEIPMHIDTININIGAQGTALSRAFIEALLRSPESDTEGAAPEAPATVAANVPPKIGEVWPGQGGIYCGVARGEAGQPDYHLILADVRHDKGYTWEAGQEVATSIEVDGHADFKLPTRFESALLYANVRDKLDTSKWHWTSTQSGEGCAFIQNFCYGDQNYDFTYNEGRCRFVRRVLVG